MAEESERQKKVAEKYQRSLRRQARREAEEEEISHNPTGSFARMILDDRYHDAQKDAERHQAQLQRQLYNQSIFANIDRNNAERQFRTNNFLNQMAVLKRNTNFLQKMKSIRNATPKSGGRRNRTRRSKRTRRSNRTRRT